MTDLCKATLHLTGIVQGVGFRPFVYGLAQRFNLRGWVRNTSGGVDIEVDGSMENLEGFVAALRSDLPPLARIDTFSTSFGSPGGFTTFEIIHSEVVEGAFQPISPDVCICTDCLRELFDPADRRHRYPFINCTNCGPRFTIIKDIPYDRPKTTMAEFGLCAECAAEYENPLDRRFHAQPVACPVCGPGVWLEQYGKRWDGDAALYETQCLLTEGGIVAIKGLGGFHLACDATNARAVVELRRRKLRVDKPFALMMADLETVKEHCFTSKEEEALLESRQRPIVVLKRRPGSAIVEQISPRQDSLGVMLPYTPLHYLVLAGDGMAMPPLVMTSGNLSEEPIATSNEEARQRLGALADAFLMHNRDIHTRCDDSVARVLSIPELPNGSRMEKGAKYQGTTYFLRRSRGYVPDSIALPFKTFPLLAVGAELKNTFCLSREGYAFVSHHIGDMENYETYASFEDGVTHFERLFRIQPQAVAYDLHPDYLTTRYALERIQRENLAECGVQHHHAHIAACMADNGLDGSQAVIGLAFDGTGYGLDGAIWGGEFLVADYAGFERKLHLDYFPLPGGDAAIKHPARVALALLWSLGLEWDESLDPVQDLGYEERSGLRIQLERGVNLARTSSMGRLFDAAAALAGVRQRVNYEAQAAMEFEAALDGSEAGAYAFEIKNDIVEHKPAISALLEDIQKHVSIPVISARFHNGLAELVRKACAALRDESGINTVALSGGVWQNIALLERSVARLRADGFNVLLHRQVPANDGGLSLGQALVGAVKIKL